MAEGQRSVQEVLQFLTTEHFTLQTQRAAASAETNSRLQLYIGALSSSIVALALVAQVSRVGSAFRGFALVLLPVIYFLGLTTLGRLRQTWMEWFRASQGINRIRRFYIEVAPEMRPYFVMPTSDHPEPTLTGIGIVGRRWWNGMVTASAVVVAINSVVAGVLTGLVAGAMADDLLVPAAIGAAGFVISWAVLAILETRWFWRVMRQVDVAFPPPDRPETPS
jgi:hypothetical protein